MDEISRLIDEDPDSFASITTFEMHYGRLEWLAYHIRRTAFQIHPKVARKLLVLLEGGEEHCFFQLKAVRREDLAPAFRDPRLTEIRNFEMAVEVARNCKFKHGHVLRACHAVGQSRGLTAHYVRNCIARYREQAKSVVAEEEMQESYNRGEIDFLGRPISE